MNMLQTINRCAGYRKPVSADCPHCGAECPLPTQDTITKTYYIACETDGCPMYVEAETLSAVGDLWNVVARD